jgi:hypothetical protein
MVKTYKIAFGEFGSIGTDIFTADEKLYKLLRDPPASIRSKYANAYIFGTMYDIKDYKLIGEHNNNAAQTMMVDVTDIKPPELAEINNREKYLKCYDKYDIDSRKALEQLRKIISNRIIFSGVTIAGDVGAGYYMHYTKGKPDSVLIDTFCLFKQKGDDTEPIDKVKIKVLKKNPNFRISLKLTSK